MFNHVYPLENIRFNDFDGRGIQNMTGMLGPEAQFIPVEDWVDMTPMTNNKMKPKLGGRKYAIIRGESHGYPTELCIGEQHGTRKQKDKPTEEAPTYFLMASFVLPFWVKNVHVLPSKAIFGGGVKLEGDFNEFFTVKTANSQKEAAFQVLPPDTMLHLLEKIPDMFVEYYQNRIIIKVLLSDTVSRSVDSTSPVHIRQTSAVFFKLAKDLVDSIAELGASAQTGRTDPENYKEIKPNLWKGSLIAGLFVAGLIYTMTLESWVVPLYLFGSIFLGVTITIIAFVSASIKRKKKLDARYQSSRTS